MSTINETFFIKAGHWKKNRSLKIIFNKPIIEGIKIKCKMLLEKTISIFHKMNFKQFSPLFPIFFQDVYFHRHICLFSQHEVEVFGMKLFTFNAFSFLYGNCVENEGFFKRKIMRTSVRIRQMQNTLLVQQKTLERIDRKQMMRAPDQTVIHNSQLKSMMY